MTAIGIIAWASFCTIVHACIFKQFKLPKKLIMAIFLAVLPYVAPVYFFWGDSFMVNNTYAVYFAIMLMSLVISLLFERTRKTFPWFFFGVIILFSLFWAIPKGLLPYRPGWEEGSPSYFEDILGGPFHHSSLAPIIASIIVLYHCLRPSCCVFEWLSKRPWVYVIALGILVFAIASQIPEIFQYGTPWW